jgi:hypothetical protein
MLSSAPLTDPERGLHHKLKAIDHLNGAPTVEINATVVATAMAIRIDV